MVDPNPGRGMPAALQRYWLAGKGAVKIRWNSPGDFKRCVRALTKYFPKEPEGLCNILHTKATGGPPGHGSAEKPLHHAIDVIQDEYSLVAASSLMAKQPELGKRLWMGPLAPIGVPTAEPRRMRVFEPGAFSARTLPLPLKWRKAEGPGHEGAVTVGRVLGLTAGPDHNGDEYLWGWGDWLDEEMVPESKTAQYMVAQGVAGASVDPGGKVVVSVNPANGGEYTSQYVVGGVTLVSTAAFDGMQLRSMEPDDWDDDDEDMDPGYTRSVKTLGSDGDCGCGHSASVDPTTAYAINPAGWEGLALAPRDIPFDNDDAVKRIAQWAGVNTEGADIAKLHRAFLWRDPRLPEAQTQSYRMPLGDVINGELTLVFHAIYAAAALISGAHGGLPSVSEEDKNKIRNVITDIYRVMANEFNDSSLRAPWDRPENEGQQFAMAEKQEPYGDVKYADPGYRDNKKRYPIDTIEHAKAAWSYINQADNAGEYTPEQLSVIKGKIQKALKKFGVAVSADAGEHSLTYSSEDESPPFPLAPPRDWFIDPQLQEKTPLTITAAGQVYGHLAAWNECHRDVSNRSCVLAPKSFKDYAPFHLGSVVTAEGDTVKVGKIVQDTRHADVRLGYAAAAIHYDDTGDEVAVVRAGEDNYGIWVAGAIVPDATARKVAKLRRSPISGDWRGVDGHLELTAALAVNVPAFPVYAMDGDDQYSLVAAGVVYPEDDIAPTGYEMPFFGIQTDNSPLVDMDALASGVLAKLRDMQAQEDRALRLAQLLEDS
jgi:hypothetical protein